MTLNYGIQSINSVAIHQPYVNRKFDAFQSDRAQKAVCVLKLKV